MSGLAGRLFSSTDSLSIIASQQKNLQSDVAGYDANRLLNTNVDDLTNYFVEKYTVDIPALLEDQMTVDQHEAQRDVSRDPRRMAYIMGDRGSLYVTGTEITVEVPFSGDSGLFKVQPSTFSSMPPIGQVRGQVLMFKYWSDTPNGQEVQDAIRAWLAEINKYLSWHRNSFRQFNDSLPREVRQAIEHRRERLLQSQNLVAGLGIALKRRPDTQTTYTAPEVKRKLVPKMPPASAGSFKPEPVLEEAEYQHILAILESMVNVMERSPGAFHGLDEESLRTLFLVSLNSHYEGSATGETFNAQGKTDILIRSGDRNIFIAECKFWSGPAKLTETIDQLLGYLSWRDSKSALLLFNRNRDFTRVLASIPPTMTAHPNFQKYEGQQGVSRFRYAFRHRDDAAKMLHITVLGFDVPKPA